LTTVDGGQGQEADVLIISMVKRFPSRFLNAKRLCVMLSRARRRLVIIGNRESHARCECKPVKELAATASVERPP
jgi:superfamily I DNA and/or RNA helicase